MTSYVPCQSQAVRSSHPYADFPHGLCFPQPLDPRSLGPCSPDPVLWGSLDGTGCSAQEVSNSIQTTLKEITIFPPETRQPLGCCLYVVCLAACKDEMKENDISLSNGVTVSRERYVGKFDTPHVQSLLRLLVGLPTVGGFLGSGYLCSSSASSPVNACRP